ncbi:MFS transporter [Kitasatospora aureofaciens]|uniref:MFS transporter n=1 Tax=Kitasatospora aureofaciens TaxID=1894 RepID=UPI0037C73362
MADVRSNRRWTTLVTSLAAMLMTLDITMLNVALPQIGTDLHATLDGLQWVVNAYTLVFAALLLTAGALSDRLGRRRIFLVGVVVFTLASATCALAPSVGVLIAARAVQGVGGAMVMGTSLALIADAFEGAAAGQRERAVALFTAGGAAAAAMGPVIGGVVVDSLDWRLLFAVNVPLGLLIVYGTVRGVPGSAGTREARLDPAGPGLAVLALFALNYGLVTGADKGWSRPDVLVALIAGAALVVVFVLVERRLGERAMLDLRLFAIPSFSGAMLLSFAARIVSFGMFPFVILWLGGILGFSPLKVGLVLFVQSAALMVGAPLSGVLAKVMPLSAVMALGMGLCGVGMFTAVGIGPHDGWTAIVPMLVLIGVGGGLAMPHLLGVAVAVVPAARAGTASGAVNSFFPLGTSVSVAVFGAVLTARVDSAMPDGALDAAGVPAGSAGTLRSLVGTGQFEAVGRLVPKSVAEPVLELARTGYTGALSTIFLVGGIAGVLAGLASLVLIRAGDNHVPVAVREPGAAEEPSAAPS